MNDHYLASPARSDHRTPPPAAAPRRYAVPAPVPSVPPRHEVPQFPPIRPRGTTGYRLRRGLRGRAGPTALALLAAAGALAAGPLAAVLPPPVAAAVHRTGCQSDHLGDHP